MECSTPGFLSLITSRSLLKLMSTESVMPSNHHTCLSIIYRSMHHLSTYPLSNINCLYIISHLSCIYLSSIIYHLSVHLSIISHLSIICLTTHLK